MSCPRIYDFIRGVEIKLAVAPCRVVPIDRPGEEPAWSFLRPNEEAVALIRRHERMLMEMGTRA